MEGRVDVYLDIAESRFILSKSSLGFLFTCANPSGRETVILSADVQPYLWVKNVKSWCLLWAKRIKAASSWILLPSLSLLISC